jgi:hypothetical protein
MEYIIINETHGLHTQTNGYNPFEKYGLPYSSMVLNAESFFQDMFTTWKSKLKKHFPSEGPKKCEYRMGLRQYLVEIEEVQEVTEKPDGGKEVEADLVIRVEQPDGTFKEFSYPLSPYHRKEWNFLLVAGREVATPDKVELHRNKKSRGRDYCYADFR